MVSASSGLSISYSLLEGCRSVGLGHGVGTNGVTITSLGKSNVCSCVVHAPRGGISPKVPNALSNSACRVRTCLDSNAFL